MDDITRIEKAILIQLLVNHLNGIYKRMPEGGSTHAIATRDNLKQRIADIEALKKKLERA